MPAKIRHSETLKAMGFESEVDEFRRALAEVKAEQFPDMTDEELCITRDEAGEYCEAIRKRLKASRLTRTFIRRALIGLRKNKRARAARST